MIRITSFFLFSFLISSELYAQSPFPPAFGATTTVDPYTGNVYQTEKSLGNTKVYGYNPNTGNKWQSETTPFGGVKGTDANGNNWEYSNPLGVGAGTYRKTGKCYSGWACR